MSLLEIANIKKTYRHINRYRHVLGILFEYGFGDLVEALNIERYVEIGLQLVSKKPRERIINLSQAERFREALEKLGPTFIKLGQILSTRRDLLPDDFIKELQRLHDKVPPFPYAEAKKLIEEEFGFPLEKLFAEFDDVPIAAASIAQVHFAKLTSGKHVAVKVQRPDIRKIIKVDIEIMISLAELLEEHIEGFKFFKPTQIINEFADSISRELNFNLEGANIERFGRQFKKEKTVYVPQVFHELTSDKVLTLEYIDGIKISDLDKLENNNLDRKKLALNGFNLILKQIFEHGFFHADPHEGNIFALKDNVICYIDFGNMGRVNTYQRDLFAELIHGIYKRDEIAVTQTIIKLSHSESFSTPDRIIKDVARFMDLYCYIPLKEIDLEVVSREIIKICKIHSLSIPPELFLMIKALTTAEGIGLLLDPEFNLVDNAAPYIRKIRLQRFSPERIFDQFTESGTEFLELLRDIPGEFRVILKMARKGKVKLELEHQGLDPMLDTYEQIGNLLCYAIVTAALIIGSSLIVLSGIPPVFYNIPVIGLVGFLVAGAMGFKLLFSILKGRNIK
ncbi:MAG: ABC1 kinase family protein [Candidatus Rifleibacteriota bacterium]